MRRWGSAIEVGVRWQGLNRAISVGGAAEKLSRDCDQAQDWLERRRLVTGASAGFDVKAGSALCICCVEPWLSSALLLLLLLLELTLGGA